MEIPEELLNLFKAVNQLNKGGEITMENDILAKDDWQNLRAKIEYKRRLLEDDIEYRRMVIRNEHNCLEDMSDSIMRRNGDELENYIRNDPEYQTLKYRLARLQDQYRYVTVLGRIPPDYDQ